MKGSTQMAKGHLEEAAGALTGNKKLSAKGRRDQIEGQVMQVIEDDVRKVKGSTLKVVGKVERMAKKSAVKLECMAGKAVGKVECIAKKVVGKAKGRN